MLLDPWRGPEQLLWESQSTEQKLEGLWPPGRAEGGMVNGRSLGIVQQRSQMQDSLRFSRGRIYKLRGRGWDGGSKSHR